MRANSLWPFVSLFVAELCIYIVWNDLFLISLRTGDSCQALREEIEYLRKQLAQAESSSQQLRGTEEQTVSGSEDQEEESDGVWSMQSVFLFVAG